MRQPFRIAPRLPVQAMKTYQVSAPLATHWRKATCEEVQCAGYVKGWKTLIDTRTVQGQAQANYIRVASGRRFTEEANIAGGVTFHFAVGQSCFRSGDHKVPLERPALYVVRSGDWRGGRVERHHATPDDWVDDFANHQLKLAETLERG